MPACLPSLPPTLLDLPACSHCERCSQGGGSEAGLAAGRLPAAPGRWEGGEFLAPAGEARSLALYTALYETHCTHTSTCVLPNCLPGPPALSFAGFNEPWERVLFKGRELTAGASLAEQGVGSGAVLTAVRRVLVADGWKVRGTGAVWCYSAQQAQGCNVRDRAGGMHPRCPHGLRAMRRMLQCSGPLFCRC